MPLTADLPRRCNRPVRAATHPVQAVLPALMLVLLPGCLGGRDYVSRSVEDVKTTHVVRVEPGQTLLVQRLTLGQAGLTARVMTRGTCRTIARRTYNRVTTRGRMPQALTYLEVLAGAGLLTGGIALLANAQDVADAEWRTADNGLVTVRETPARFFAYMFGVLFSAAGGLGTLHGSGEGLYHLFSRSSEREAVADETVVRSAPCSRATPVGWGTVALLLDGKAARAGKWRNAEGQVRLRPGGSARLAQFIIDHPLPASAALLVTASENQASGQATLDPAKLPLLLTGSQRQKLAESEKLQRAQRQEQAARQQAEAERSRQLEARRQARVARQLQQVQRARSRCAALRARLAQTRQAKIDAARRTDISAMVQQEKAMGALSGELRAVGTRLRAALGNPDLAPHRAQIRAALKACRK